MSTGNTTEHRHPDQRGISTYLRPEAQGAWRVYTALLSDRIAAIRGEQRPAKAHRAKIEEAIATDPQAIGWRLVAAAVADADAEAIRRDCDGLAIIRLQYAEAVRLHDLHDAIDPRPEPARPETPAQPTVCRHGVAWSADCAKCDAGE